MKVVNEIYVITKELNQILDQLPLDENREEYINRIEKLLEARGKAIESLPKILNNKQETIVREVSNIQIEIDRKLNRFYKEIEKDLVKTGQKKRFQEKYKTKPILVDGMFVDKRK